jgi:uncharacterized protein
MTAAAPAAPTAPGERIAILDVLRGLALYGVLLANSVPWFSGWAFLPRPRPATAPQIQAADRLFLSLMRLFVDGKAMALLTFLFGLGFALQLQRAERDGRSGVPEYLRRLAALGAIGAAHVLLLWWGDILWSYAIAGVGLLLFRRSRDGRLVVWGFALSFVPMLLVLLPKVAPLAESLLPKPADPAAFRAQVLAAMTGHDRLLLTQMHIKQSYYHVGRIWVWYFPSLVGHFLIGRWAGAARLFQPTSEHLRFFRKLAAAGLLLGIAGSSIFMIFQLMHIPPTAHSERFWMALSIPSELGAMLLSCGYAAAIVLLFQRPAWRQALMWFAPVGQMPLTTYLSQSLLCTLLFYGWGFGLLGRVRPVALLPLTAALFCLQILFARAWLTRYRFGPMEWLWRSLTYWRLQPIRRL